MRSGALTAVLASLGTVTRAQNCTFDSITPSQDLVWCQCEGDYLCAKLDVRNPTPTPSHPHLLTSLLTRYP